MSKNFVENNYYIFQKQNWSKTELVKSEISLIIFDEFRTVRHCPNYVHDHVFWRIYHGYITDISPLRIYLPWEVSILKTVYNNWLNTNWCDSSQTIFRHANNRFPYRLCVVCVSLRVTFLSCQTDPCLSAYPVLLYHL